jgi:ADP-ribose pyrophosphatase
MTLVQYQGKARMTQDFSEHRIDSEAVFDGALLHVRRDKVRLPDGTQAVREYIIHPGAVLIIPLLDAETVILERQYRYAGQRHFIELPAGKKEAGEDALLTAQRELEEETGYRARSWQKLATTHPSVGYSNEHIDYFIARDLTQVGARLDDGEFLEIMAVKLSEAIAWIKQGKITDIKTIAGLFWLAHL